MKKVVILLNMGGAENLGEVGIFLKNMFNDKYILTIKNERIRSILAWIIAHSRLNSARKNYEKIGGKSPLGALTRDLIANLNSLSDEFVFDYAMNYTPPFASDTFKKYPKESEFIVFPLYPHYSQTTIKSSVESAMLAATELGISHVKNVDYFYEDSDYSDIIVKNIVSSIANEDPSKIDLIFSAHSLPLSIIESGDPYKAHIENHVEILRSKLSDIGFKSISLAYQSRLGPIKWLSPNISDAISAVKSKRVLIYPISFCVDNSETDFELDIFYREFANKLDFTYFKVVKAPNSDLEFAKFILKKVREIDVNSRLN